MCFLVGYPSYSQNTISLQNPSLEGPPQPHVVPAPWNDCYGSPDTQPGTWDIETPASDDSTYVSMLRSGFDGYAEGMSQELTTCLQAGYLYSFQVDLAFSNVYNTAEPENCYGSMEVLGANSTCGTEEVLWQSGMITDTTWQTYTVTIAPSSNYCYLSFRPYVIDTCTGFINVLVDNFQTGQPPFTIETPNNNSNQSCSFMISGIVDSSAIDSVLVVGNFISSPTVTSIVNSTTWEAQLYYPYGYAGNDSITAIAYYPGDTLYRGVNVNIEASLAPPEICLVSVDSSYVKNIVTWNWPIASDIDYYNVYKEGTSQGSFNYIGSVSYNSISEFIDTSSTPQQNADIYKLSLVDTCGMETDLGEAHKTIHLSINQGISGEVNLIWNHYEGQVISSYNIYRGATSSSLNLLTTISSSFNSYTDLSPPSGLNYYLIEAVYPDGCGPPRSINNSLSNIPVTSVTITGEATIKEVEFDIYPNPADDNVIIIMPYAFNDGIYEVYDVLGQEVKNGLLTSDRVEISLVDVAKGTYFIRISSEVMFGVEKVVVK